MEFTDVCIISSNVVALAEFYQALFQIESELDSIHTFIKGPGLSIAIYDKKAAEKDGMDFIEAGTGMTYLGFNVDDVDMEYERVKVLNADILTQPRLWPWGAKSFTFNDPDGNKLVFRSWPKQG